MTNHQRSIYLYRWGDVAFAARQSLLILDKLIEVTIERTLRDVPENLNFGVFVALPDDPAKTLREVEKPPRAIQQPHASPK